MPSDWLDQLPETDAWPEWDRENLREKFALLGLDPEKVILDTQRNRIVYELTAGIDRTANPNSPIRAALWDLVASEEKRMTLWTEERERASGEEDKAKDFEEKTNYFAAQSGPTVTKRGGTMLYAYKLYNTDGSEAGEAHYAVRIEPGEIVWTGARKLRGVVVPTDSGNHRTSS